MAGEMAVSPEFMCTYGVGKILRRGMIGKRCERPPVRGTAYCERHSGKDAGKTARRRAKWAEDLVGKSEINLVRAELGDMVDILKRAEAVDPGVLLLEEVARCAAVVGWLEDRIGQMSEEELMYEPELLQIRERKRAASAGGDSYVVKRMESRTTVSRYWNLLQEERRLLVRATEAALRSGIEERRVRIQERAVNSLEAAVAGALMDLGLDPHSEKVRAVVGKRLREALEANGAGSLFLGAADRLDVPVEVPAERVDVQAAPPPATAF